MNKRSSVSIGTILKGARILAPHPWIFSKLIRLQTNKLLFPRLHHSKADTGWANRIQQVSIRITDICNLRCHTCGQWGDNGFMHHQNLQEKKKEEVDPQRYVDIFADLKRNGHKPNIYIWGGEPMLYEGLMDVMQGATRLGLPVSIATNGHGLSKAAAEIIAMPLFLLQVSVDGSTEEMHNSARPSAGKGNAYADVVAGLTAVREQKRDKGVSLPLVASLTVVSKHNVDHLIDIYEAFRDKVDIFVFYLSWWIDEEHAAAHEQDYASRFGRNPVLHRGWIGNWCPKDYEMLARQFKELQRISKPLTAPAVTFLPDLTNAVDLEKYYTDHSAGFGFDECISIFQAVELDSNGDMSPCRDYHDYIVGNIKEKTISELWNSTAYRTFRSSLRIQGLMPVCKRCCGLMGY